MIDVSVTNLKLLERATGIVSSLAGVSQEKAREYLLQSIYNSNQVTEEMAGSAPERHIIVASEKSFVVPVALLLALQPAKLTTASARELLSQEPVVRKLIHQLKGKN